ncbi:X-ray repair cross complementing 2 [Nomia melanderi]|uniref:X-ray repair cross complementing 2 n=1 Tax=Nomia melanderi TaxID=2448451 RepID=UPI001303F5D8|nr:DNA repair protein XRCC2 [Nomia melanderi]
MQSQIESGVELFARLNKKPSLQELEDTLFLEGPKSTDVIEINGAHSSGKTLLLSQLLAKCILPDYHGTVRIKGCNAPAILINTDHHFQVSRLIEIMTGVVNVAYAESFKFDPLDTELEKINIIQNSLSNLKVINCYHSEQFLLMLRTLDDMFLSNAKIALLAIDSMTAYYWQERENNVVTIDTYIKRLLKLVKKQTNLFNVVTVYTKPYESTINYKAKRSTIDPSTNDTECKIHLRKANGLRKFTCTLERGEAIKHICYSVSASGIKWEID